MKSLTGRCRCGAVAYAVDGEVKYVVNCHCNLCRGMNGAAFSTYAIVDVNAFTVTQGQGSLNQYAVTDTALKHFCDQCGSPLFNTNIEKYGDHAMLYVGTLDDSANLPEPVNIFHENRLTWTDHLTSLVSHERLPER